MMAYATLQFQAVVLVHLHGTVDDFFHVPKSQRALLADLFRKSQGFFDKLFIRHDLIDQTLLNRLFSFQKLSGVKQFSCAGRVDPSNDSA